MTTRDRFGLVSPQSIDITLRMLDADELAGGQGFPAGYRFVGNDREVKAQIGNAWEVTKATALFSAVLREHFAIDERQVA